MAAYRRVYDSRHLQADCQVPGNRVWATFTFYTVYAVAQLRAGKNARKIDKENEYQQLTKQVATADW